MKVGILSMQRIINYGSFMQSYALKRIIESMGHEVEFVDYRVEAPIFFTDKEKKNYRKTKIMNFIKDFIVTYNGLFFLLPKEKRETFEHYKRYNKEFLLLLGVSNKRNYNPKLDVLIIGSDEVFNCLQKNPRVGYSRELFGVNNNAKKLMSYAASFGNTTLQKLNEYGVSDEVSDMLSKFDCISVRDSNSGKIVDELTGKEPNYNLDPVLIYDFSKEIPNIQIKSDYIVVYAYPGRLKSEEKKAIRDFAEKKKKRLVCLGGYQDFCDEYIDATPFELLAYVKNADYVITDTFHGTIYSIINNKQFVSFIRKSTNGSYGNQEKMTDLLQRLGLLKRGIFESKELETVIEQSIDYNEVEKLRKIEIENAINYLKKNLITK